MAPARFKGFVARAFGRDAAAGLERRRHWAGFLVSGGIAFFLDWGTMEAGVRLLGMPPLVARLMGIVVAMVGAWLAHRRLTFALTQAASLPEFLRYATAAWMTAAINFTCFAAILVVAPTTSRFAALVAASILATIFSYVSMRYGVFRRSRG